MAKLYLDFWSLKPKTAYLNVSAKKSRFQTFHTLTAVIRFLWSFTLLSTLLENKEQYVTGQHIRRHRSICVHISVQHSKLTVTSSISNVRIYTAQDYPFNVSTTYWQAFPSPWVLRFTSMPALSVLSSRYKCHQMKLLHTPTDFPSDQDDWKSILGFGTNL